MDKDRARRKTVRTIVMLMTVSLVGSWSSSVEAQGRGVLYASVLDGSGDPVLDLSPGDFAVSVGPDELTVLSAELDAAPLKIALMVDNGNVMAEANADNALRDGLEAFLETLDARHEVGFFTIARNVRERVGFTTNRTLLRQETLTIFSDTGAGARMMDGLFETWERRFHPEDSWPVFVLVLTDGSELSGYVSDEDYNEFVNDLIRRGSSVHAVLFTRQGSNNRLGDRQIQYAINLTENTGGLYRSINLATGLTGVLGDFATQLNHQYDQVSTRYRIEFDVPEGLRARGISVEVSREGGTLQLFPDRRVD